MSPLPPSSVSGKRRPYVQGGEKTCIILHLSAHSRGYKQVERGSRSQVSMIEASANIGGSEFEQAAKCGVLFA